MKDTYTQTPLGELWSSIQTWLFPALEDGIGELDEKHRLFVAVCELCAPHRLMGAYAWCGNGCPPSDRLALCKAFIAKSVWDFATTSDLIDAIMHRPALRRLCGWETHGEVPSESTFSRSFAAFAGGELAQRLHAALLKTHYGGKLAGHISRDSTAIHAREKAAAKTPQGKRDRGGRRIDRPQPPEPESTRLQRQLRRDLRENLDDLPRACDWGCKRNSRGKTEYWRGYKAHLDVIDGDIPVSFILSSASLHDSQAAIPLAQMSATRVVNLYDLADAAYDAKEIRQMSRSLGHVPVIDRNRRRGGVEIGFDPAEARRYRERSAVERVNSHLHEKHGGRHVRVRGPAKVAAHLAFGLLVIAAEQILGLIV